MNQVRPEYWAALQSGDRAGALEVVKALHASGTSPTALIDDLIVPAQARIGELWLAGIWSVDQEHTATAINEGLVHWLGSFAPDPHPDQAPVVVACVEDERHSLPALVVAEGLAWAGRRVVHVAAERGFDDVVHEIVRLRPRAVLFSASLTSSLAPQKRLFGGLAALGIPVIVGGSAYGGDPRRAAALGATGYAATVAEAIRLLDELPERLEPVEPEPPGPADAEALWLVEHRRVLTAGVVARLLDHLGIAGRGTPPWWPDLEGHVEHVLGCVAAALVTGDETIMVEVHDWLRQVVEARGGDPEVVTALWRLVASPLRGHPLARVHLAAATSVDEVTERA